MLWFGFAQTFAGSIILLVDFISLFIFGFLLIMKACTCVLLSDHFIYVSQAKVGYFFLNAPEDSHNSYSVVCFVSYNPSNLKCVKAVFNIACVK